MTLDLPHTPHPIDMNRDGGGRAMADQQRQPPRRRRRWPVGLVKLSLRLLLVVAVVLLDAGHAVPVASTASQDVADPHTGVRGIVMRLLGEEKGQGTDGWVMHD